VTEAKGAQASARASANGRAGGAGEGHYTADEMMTVAASRELKDGAVCFVGIGLPSEAANLARATHAPECFLIYESGTLGAKPDVLPLSIGDGVLAEHADSVVSVPEVFNYWLQAGRVDVGFLGAAQIDRFANINTTVVGDYGNPKVRLPGAGGAPEIAASAREVIIMLRHKKRAFVGELSFVTSVGHGTGKGSRESLGLLGAGPTVVITDLGLLRPDGETGELTLTALHLGATVREAREATGWDLKVADDLATTGEPTDEELAVLRDLRERTEAARRRAPS
jgi:glutaconate CoA-transferase subunit B